MSSDCSDLPCTSAQAKRKDEKRRAAASEPVQKAPKRVQSVLAEISSTESEEDAQLDFTKGKTPETAKRSQQRSAGPARKSQKRTGIRVVPLEDATTEESEDDEEFVGEKKNKMVHSIHRISIQSVREALKNRAQGNWTESEIISRMVRLINLKLKDESKYSQTGNVQLLNGYEVVVYSSRTLLEDKLLNGLKINHENVVAYNRIAFFYKPGEIYTSTTKHAWNAVHNFSDFNFPKIIAARLLKKEGPIKSSQKKLVGNIRSQTQYKKTEDGTNPLDVLNLRTNFVAEFRPNCSIYGLNLNCFKINRHGDLKNNIKVACGAAFVRIQTEMKIFELTYVLAHYTAIINGEATYLHGLEEPEEESNSTVYDQELDWVSAKLNTTLNLKLLEIIKNAILHKRVKPDLHNYDLCHKHSEDYTLASKIVLKHGTLRKIRSFPPYVALSQIILASCRWSKNYATLCQIMQENLKQLSRRSNDEFNAAFHKFKLSFQYNGVEKTAEKILNYIEGDIIHNDHVYWKVNTKWCSVNNMIGVQQNFQDVLSKHLFNNSQKNFLQIRKPWARNNNPNSTEADRLKEYIAQYKAEDNCFLFQQFGCEEIASQSQGSASIKLYDLLKIGNDGEIALYFVQNGFRAIRNASMRIKVSLNGLNRATDLSGNNTSVSCQVLKQNYGKYIQNDLFKEKFPNFLDFQKGLKNGTLVFALVDSQEEMENPIARSLNREKDLQSELKLRDLEELLEASFVDMDNENPSDLKIDLANYLQKENYGRNEIPEAATKIYAELKNVGFIQENDIVTNQILVCTKMEFDDKLFKDNLHLQQCMYDFIKNNYQSAYRHLLPKLELMEIQIILKDSSFVFKICEIPLAQ